MNKGPYYYLFLMIGYFIIYFGGIGILARIWRKAERERKKEELNETEKENH